LKVQTHHSDGSQFDFPSTPSSLTLEPGQVYLYSETGSLPKTGDYTAFINNIKDGRWSQTYPASESTSIIRKDKLTIKPAVTLTESLQFSTTSTRVGLNITATFKMTNHSTKPVSVGRHKV